MNIEKKKPKFVLTIPRASGPVGASFLSPARNNDTKKRREFKTESIWALLKRNWNDWTSMEKTTNINNK